MYKKVAVGTDLSPTARVASDHAAALAERLGAGLVLIHVGTDPGPALQELADSYGAEARVVSGNPAEALLTESESVGADLLCVGSVGMSGARRFMLGNVPNKVSHHADRDLLIVKSDSGAKGSGYSKILVGTDGSPTAMRAVQMAAELATALGAHMTIVTAYEPPTEAELKAYRSGGSDAISQWNAPKGQKDTPAEFQWRIADASRAQDVLERAEDCAADRGADFEVRAIEGPPADTLLEIAEKENFDLIAVGSVGMAGPKRFMLGNVPHRLSHHTPTDLLILRTA
jgi:nucleotide-binding universal stress UspA family protein